MTCCAVVVVVVVVGGDPGSWRVTGWAVKLRFMNVADQILVDADALDDDGEEDEAEATATVP